MSGLATAEHEQVVVGHDAASGLRCIIAIHSTALGPALGGTRFRPYDSFDDAMTDALRLSQAMTFKNAGAGLDRGGGKAVIIGDPAAIRSESLIRAYGRMVGSLGGRYITACDVGTTPDDMSLVRRETRWATGMDPSEGGSGDSGILTAEGVLLGLKVTAEEVFGSSSLADRHIAVQGLGKVGRRLVEHLVAERARITASDVDNAAVERVRGLDGVDVVGPHEILQVDADILSPNALGAVLNEQSIPRLRVAAICGAANNQLATEDDATRLHDAGILYAPDFVVSAGGVISVDDELQPGGWTPQRARRRLQVIPETLRAVIDHARTSGITAQAAAIELVHQRINSIGALRGFWMPADHASPRR
ncbi:MAG: Glu/Leu/Phe/Val dehydrogenase dimerization domain-containing protein [Nitriliruptoraceae bacterium]